MTFLPRQPLSQQYADLGDLWVEIPSLGVKEPITGVPEGEKSWDVSWLGDQIGWLEGTTYPTLSGNSVLVGHVYNNFGLPGPFSQLGSLRWGQKIIVHAFGQQYVYEVRDVQMQVNPADVAAVTKHEDRAWLTLVTCQGYDALTGGFRWRTAVRAVLVDEK
jgi:LPXTG-site transpeptidase (sortase) family protein